MESASYSFICWLSPTVKPAEMPLRQVNGVVTTRLYIQMVSKILTSSQALRKRSSSGLNNRVTTEPVRKELNRNGVIFE